MNNRLYNFIPFFILIYFFIHFGLDYYYFIDLKSFVLKFILYSLITGLIFLAGLRFFSKREAFIAAFSTVLFLFLFFGSIQDTAAKAGLSIQQTGVSLQATGLFLFLIALVIFILFRIRKTFIFNLLTFWLVYCTILTIYDTAGFIFTDKPEKNQLSHNVIRLTKNKITPVFYIVFDMYPSDSVLNKYFGHDNSELSNFLKTKGFYTTGNSVSQYAETYYSVPSTLSLSDLDFVSDKNIPEYKKKLIALKENEDPLLIKSFLKEGYSFRNNSVFNIADKPTPLAFNLAHHLDDVLTSSTIFNRFYSGFEADYVNASKGLDLSFIKSSWSQKVEMDIRFLQRDFTLMLKNYDSTKPAFNYFHFMMPHPPVLYDSNGNKNSINDMYSYNGFYKTISNFSSYIRFVNKEIMKMVNALVSSVGSDVIIILQGDHGYRNFTETFPDAVRHGILNAVYLPERNYEGFHDRINPVETFRLILKNQFGYSEE